MKTSVPEFILKVPADTRDDRVPRPDVQKVKAVYESLSIEHVDTGATMTLTYGPTSTP